MTHCTTEPPTTKEPEMPRHSADDVRTAMADIWAGLVGQRPVDDNDFFELGGGSMELVMLMMTVDERFGVALSIDELFVETFTFGDCVRNVTRALEPASGSAR
jgi:acyl carrier protein